MDIPVHKKRFVILAAFDAYAKVLAAAKKANETAHCITSDVDEKVVILEHLRAEYQNLDGQLTLDGTPLGEAMTDAHYKDDDGTPLGADHLDDWMRRTAGAYVPFAVIAEWVLEKRKLVAAWLRPIDTSILEATEKAQADLEEPGAELPDDITHKITDDAQRVGRTCAPAFIDVAWFTPPTPITAAPMSDAELTEWETKGPWSVGPYDAPDGEQDEHWEVIRKDGDTVADRATEVFVVLFDARLHAAQRNKQLAESAPLHPADEPEAVSK